MKLQKQFYFFPGGDDEIIDDNAASQEGSEAQSAGEEHVGFFDKVKKALQDWSNDDYEDTLEDDRTP